MALYCIYCGTPLPDIANFCFSCGKPPKGEQEASTPDLIIDEDIANADGVPSNLPPTRSRRSAEATRSNFQAAALRAAQREAALESDDVEVVPPHFTPPTQPRSSAVKSRPIPEEYVEYDEDDLYVERPLSSRYAPPTTARRYPTTRRLRAYKPQDTQQLINNIEEADLSDTKQVAITNLELINRYRQSVLEQARRSFHWALIAACIGLIFFIGAVSLVVLKQPASVSIISIIGGVLVYVISAINFYLYRHASNQLASFHVFLDRIHRYIIADSFCENLEDNQVKDTTRTEIVRNLIKTGSLQNIENAKMETSPPIFEAPAHREHQQL